MEFKLFVDDTREFPEGFICARSYDEAIKQYMIYGSFSFVTTWLVLLTSWLFASLPAYS